MKASLEPLATQYIWVCTNCNAKFDAFWRPVKGRACKPPAVYQWMQDKPTFIYCPSCGIKFGDEAGEECGKETCEL